MAIAPALSGLTLAASASALRPVLSSSKTTQSFCPAPLCSSTAAPSHQTPYRSRVHTINRHFLSGNSVFSSALRSASSWKPVIGQQDLQSHTTMASANTKPIQLYSLATPNGQKIGIFLEESGIPYEAHLIDMGKGEQFSPEFVKINPNSKIPAIIDPSGPNGEEIRVFESGAILLYLAEKYNSPLYPKDDPGKKAETLGWLFWQVGGLGPMMGQVAHYYRFAKEDVPYAKERYLTEAKRLLTVLDKALEGKEYLTGEYSIADISSAPLAKSVEYVEDGILSFKDYPNVKGWVDRIFARPQVQKGLKVCAKA